MCRAHQCKEQGCKRSPGTALSRSSAPPAVFGTGQQTLAAHLELDPEGPAQGPGKGIGSDSPERFHYCGEDLSAPTYRHPTLELAEHVQPGRKHSISAPKSSGSSSLPPSRGGGSVSIHNGIFCWGTYPSTVPWSSLFQHGLPFPSKAIPSLVCSFLPQHGHPFFDIVISSSALSSFPQDGHCFLLV